MPRSALNAHARYRERWLRSPPMLHRVINAGSRERDPIASDLLRYLSDAAISTRRPGQTIEQRFRELQHEETL
jgi:hypothetical protein